MKIVLAKSAGFCMGVRRAVEMALDAPHKYQFPIYTFGPLIHNPQVLDLLEERNIKVISDIPEKGSGTVIIRAHGVPPETKERLTRAGFTVIDATCPRVIKVQTIIRKYAKKGFSAIIIGDKEHPEVTGLLGYAGGNGYVAGNMDELNELPALENAVIVAQTTQNTDFYKEVEKWAACRFPHYQVFDTICDSTENRQAEVRRLVDDVDAFVVVGGRNSGNTRRLASIAGETGKPAFHIETETELEAGALSEARRIGITAGASTPNWIIRRVYRTIETLPTSRVKSLGARLFNLQRSLLLTNVYAALGAGCLCYAASKLQGIPNSFPVILISMLYILAMHMINNLTGSKADHYNDPDRAAFYTKYKIPLILMAVCAVLFCLIVAFFQGLLSFLVILVMGAMGLSYNLKLIPRPFHMGKYYRIRDIPGSKTILIAAAWGTVTSVFPILTIWGKLEMTTLFAFLWTASLAFVRTAFTDIIDVQGDRIVGRETIPTVIGEKRAMASLKYTLVGISLLFLMLGVLQLISGLGLLLIICPVFMLATLFVHEKGVILPGIRLEFLIESHFFLAGLLTYIWIFWIR